MTQLYVIFHGCVSHDQRVVFEQPGDDAWSKPWFLSKIWEKHGISLEGKHQDLVSIKFEKPLWLAFQGMLDASVTCSNL